MFYCTNNGFYAIGFGKTEFIRRTSYRPLQNPGVVTPELSPVFYWTGLPTPPWFNLQSSTSTYYRASRLNCSLEFIRKGEKSPFFSGCHAEFSAMTFPIVTHSVCVSLFSIRMGEPKEETAIDR